MSQTGFISDKKKICIYNSEKWVLQSTEDQSLTKGPTGMDSTSYIDVLFYRELGNSDATNVVPGNFTLLNNYTYIRLKGYLVKVTNTGTSYTSNDNLSISLRPEDNSIQFPDNSLLLNLNDGNTESPGDIPINISKNLDEIPVHLPVGYITGPTLTWGFNTAHINTSDIIDALRLHIDRSLAWATSYNVPNNHPYISNKNNSHQPVNFITGQSSTIGTKQLPAYIFMDRARKFDNLLAAHDADSKVYHPPFVRQMGVKLMPGKSKNFFYKIQNNGAWIQPAVLKAMLQNPNYQLHDYIREHVTNANYESFHTRLFGYNPWEKNQVLEGAVGQTPAKLNTNANIQLEVEVKLYWECTDLKYIDEADLV